MKGFELFKHRPMIESDKDFITSTWLRNNYHSSSFFKYIPFPIYNSEYRKIIDNLLARSHVNICCLEEDENVIIGYAVLEPIVEALHWIYVKPPWRGMKISKYLLEEESFSYVTHLTLIGKQILRSHQALLFNPFLL